MNYFLYVVIVLFALSVIGKISWVASDSYPERTRKSEVWDIALSTALLVWAINLLI